MSEERPYEERPAAKPNAEAVQRAAAEQAAQKRSQQKWYQSCWTWGCALPVVLGLVFGIGAALTGGGSSGSGSGAMIVTCQNLVKNNLKSPSTASFPSVPRQSGSVISGQVDSENGFGAQIRSSFQCTVVSSDTVRLDWIR